jgi:hypothetical protein
MDDVTVSSIQALITETEEQKKAAARKVRKLKRLLESAETLEAVLESGDLPTEE